MLLTYHIFRSHITYGVLRLNGLLVIFNALVDILLESETSGLREVEQIKLKLLVRLDHVLVANRVLLAQLFLDNWDDTLLLSDT